MGRWESKQDCSSGSGITGNLAAGTSQQPRRVWLNTDNLKYWDPKVWLAHCSSDDLELAGIGAGLKKESESLISKVSLSYWPSFYRKIGLRSLQPDDKLNI